MNIMKYITPLFFFVWSFFTHDQVWGANPETMTLQNTAVVIVDAQYDFTKTAGLYGYKSYEGSLAVPKATDDYVKKVKYYTKFLQNTGILMTATQDYHPEGHISFFSRHKDNPKAELFKLLTIGVWPNGKERTQVMWPDHCVQNTFGSELFIETTGITVFPKGTNIAYDSYSGFKDDGGQETGLNAFLKSKQIKNLIIYGLATDYCVRFTVLHAIEAGYNVFLVEDLSEGVAENTTKEAMAEMINKGSKIIKMDTVTQWLKSFSRNL